MGKLTESISPGGVSQSVYDAHTHDYRKITQVGADGSGSYANPARVAVADDSEVNITDSNKCNAIGVTVATQATEAPN